MELVRSTRIVLPNAVLTEIEQGLDAADAEINVEVVATQKQMEVLHSGAVTLAKALGLIRQRGLAVAKQNDDTDTYVEIWNIYIGDLLTIGADLDRARPPY